MGRLTPASRNAIVFAVIVVAVAIAAVVAYFVTQGTGDGTVKSGGACSVNTDCEGFAFLQPDSLSCCNKTCQKLYKDWVGIGVCGTDCKGGIFDANGTCYPNPRQLGEPCDVVLSPCDGSLDTIGNLYCCSNLGGSNTCKEQVSNGWGLAVCP
jgi:hypothetical protein